ncbi:hypothetical protein Tco_0370112 [Tanacetum coccineum]
MGGTRQRRGLAEVEKQRLLKQPPTRGGGRFNRTGNVPSGILEGPVPEGYIRLPDGMILACYVCQPPIFMRAKKKMDEHKSKEKWRRHEKMLKSMRDCKKCFSLYSTEEELVEEHLSTTSPGCLYVQVCRYQVASKRIVHEEGFKGLYRLALSIMKDAEEKGSIASGKIPSIKQSQSLSLVQSTGRLKRDRATLSVDENGTKTLICEGARSRGLGGSLKSEDGEQSKDFPVTMNYQHPIAGKTSYHNKHECISRQIGAFAAPDRIHWAPSLPKTISGKIMRRILRKIASRQLDELGDISTLADPSVVDQLIALADS